jgi:Flp pilus assembly protein TadD
VVFSNKFIKIVVLMLICLSLGHKTLAMDPEVMAKKALCHTCLAKIYVAQGQDPEATKEYQELLKLTPNDASAHFDFGNVLARNNKPDLAAAQFKLAAKLKPTIPEYQVGLGNAFMYTKNYEGAVQAYTKACTLGGKYQTQLQTAQQYQAQQKLLDQYKNKVQQQQENSDE